MKAILWEMVLRHRGGVPVGFHHPEDLAELLAEVLQEKEAKITELLSCLAEIRECALDAMWCIDKEKYKELLGPCIGSPAEVVRAVEVLCSGGGLTEIE